MKVALIFGNYERQGFYPLGIMYLAAYARKYGKENIDYILYDIMPDINELMSKNYDVIGFSCLTIQFPRVNKYAQKLRKVYQGIILAGGIHFSLLEQIPNWADVVILGEGEKTFCELMYSIATNGGLNKAELLNLPGIIFRDEDGRTHISVMGTFIKEIDQIPFPARDLVDMEKYLLPNNVFGTKVGRGLGMMTSRGCAFNCEFCSTAKTWGNPRFHSAEYVVNEIKDVYEKYKIQYIYFEDDNFCGSKKRLIELGNLLEKENLPIEFGASGRVDFVTEEMLDVYKKIGLKALSFGLETGSNHMLRKIKDLQYLTVEEEIDKVKMVLDAGIEVHGMFMLNMPGETYEDMMLTKKVIEEVPFSKIAISLASPYYGTKWWDEAVRQGIVPENPNENFWELYDMHSYAGDNRPLFINDVSREKVLEIYESISRVARSRWNYDWRKRKILCDGRKN
mgnify:CR=1 FL=1